MSGLRELIKAKISEGKTLPEIYSETGESDTKINFYKQTLLLIQEGQVPNVMACYCGHDCSRCKTFRATLSNDDEMRKNIAEYYKQSFGKDLPINEFYCLGGRSDEIMRQCLECPFVACCLEKGIASCSECVNPCPTFEWYTREYVNKANQI